MYIPVSMYMYMILCLMYIGIESVVINAQCTCVSVLIQE